LIDIIFEGREYRKEDFAYYPSEEPEKRMLYCAAFWELWKSEKWIMGREWRGKRFDIYMKFLKYFNGLYRIKKKGGRPITWDDFKDLNL
jgi:hypothetical protein